MAQIREGCYRVMDISPSDIDLVDLHNPTPFPVSVESEHPAYSDDINDGIEELQKGNVINAKIQSDDVLHIDGIWKFIEIDVVTNTLISTFDHQPISGRLEQDEGFRLQTAGGVYDEFTAGDAETVRVVKTIDHEDKGDWRNFSYLDAHKGVSRLFDKDASPPYEIIHMREPEEELIKSYYIDDIGTDFAEKVKPE